MRSFTVTELTARLERLLDIENDTHISPQMKLDSLNVGLAKFYDFLINADYSDHLVKSATFTTTSAQSYALATVVPDGDFYKLRGLYVQVDSNQWRPLSSVPEWYMQSSRPPESGATIRLDYIPCAPILASGSDTVDGINGWEELILVYAGLDIRSKRQEDPGYLAQKQRELEDRIIKMAQRDTWYPDKMIWRKRRRDPYGTLCNRQVDGYRLRGGNIELYKKEAYGLY